SCTVRARAILLALTACHLRHPPCLLRDPATPEIYTLSLHDALPIFFTSPPKKSLPLIRTLVTASPCAVTLPSLSTSTPCNRFSASSATEPSRNFRSRVEYSTVSPFTCTVMTPSTTTSSSIFGRPVNTIVGSIILFSPCGKEYSCSKGSNLKLLIRMRNLSDCTLLKV